LAHTAILGGVTYSIVARDEQRMGVAVQTCVMGVGAICSWGRAGVGVVTTQAMARRDYGPHLLDRLAAGAAAGAALAAEAERDDGREQRQVAVLDAAGEVASFTGADTIPIAGDLRGDGFGCQANMMSAAGVPEAMRDAFTGSRGPLERRLLAALVAAEAAGGDLRGRQSGALLVVDAQPKEEPWQGVAVDLRVDDDPEPLLALNRLLDVHEAYELNRACQDAARRGDLVAAAALSERALALAPHDQNVVFTAALLRAHGPDAEPLRELIRRRPGTLGLLEWLRTHGEVQLPEAVMARLRP
jgi:uncharacterized Ntn-hydrolase superfamily protein